MHGMWWAELLNTIFGIFSSTVTVQRTVAVSGSTSPYINVYPWTSGTGFGTKYSNPATLPSGIGWGTDFIPDGSALAVSYGTSSPWVNVYAWSSTGFGTKYSDPATTPTGTGYGVNFNAQSTNLAVGKIVLDNYDTLIVQAGSNSTVEMTLSILETLNTSTITD